MSTCLAGSSETKGPHYTKGKPCGNSCIAKDKVCPRKKRPSLQRSDAKRGRVMLLNLDKGEVIAKSEFGITNLASESRPGFSRNILIP